MRQKGRERKKILALEEGSDTALWDAND